MENNSTVSRKQLVCYLLLELKNTCIQLEKMESEMSSSADVCLKRAFVESIGEIMPHVNEYNDSIQEMEKINQQVTALMKDWYSFSLDENNTSGLLFPVKFFIKRKEIKEHLEQARNKMSDKIIQNRKARAKLDEIEEKLRDQAVLKMKIKMKNGFQSYSELMSRKKEILDHLAYLLSTIPELYPIEFSIKDIDALIVKLS